MLASFLALGSSLCWGTSDYLGGLKGRSLPLLTVLLLSQSTALLLLTALVLLLGQDVPPTRMLVIASAAGVGELLGVSALYRGLSAGAMSIVAPFANLAPVVALAVSFALGEMPRPLQLAGLALVIFGIVLSAAKQRSAASEVDGDKRTASIAYGLVAALGFGGFFVGVDKASEASVTWTLLTVRATAVTLVCAAALTNALLRRAGAHGSRPSRAEWAVLMAVGALIVGADTMYAVATTRGLLSVVAVLAALHPIVTVALARLHSKEPITRGQYIGIATCFVGVAALTAP